MAKLFCGDVSCKYNGDNNVCMAKKVNLGWNSIMTMWQGRRELLNCNTYKKDERYSALVDYFDNFMSEVGRSE